MSYPSVYPCPIVNGTCTPTYYTGFQGLLLQNAAGEPVVAVSQNLATPYTFMIPHLIPPSGQSDTQPVYVVLVKASSPIVFSLAGQNSAISFGTVTTTSKPPTQPVAIAVQPTPIVPPLALPSQWNPPDIRKEKPVWVLIAAGALFLVVAVLLIVVGATKNKQTMRLFAQLKNVTDDESKELLEEDDALTPEYAPFRATGMIVAGSILIAVIIGLTVGALFLPGYPLSKYMSYAKCYQLAANDPSAQWSWSITPYSGIWEFFCRALGACICRSTTYESNCFMYAIANPDYSPNVWQAALKRAPISNDCFCCANDSCGKVINDKLVSCTQE